MTQFASDAHPEWQRRIKRLTESAWRDAEINESKVDRWLNNFRGERLAKSEERKLALHLLQQFIYFGAKEVDECMRVLARDHLLYPITQQLRPQYADLLDLASAVQSYVAQKVCLIGVGFPAESGPHMLYRFAKASNISVSNFPSIETVAALDSGSYDHIIFIDDLCATGDQVKTRLTQGIGFLRKRHPNAKFAYFLLFGTTRGLESVRQTKLFDDVVAAITLDDDYKVFADTSIYYVNAGADGVRREDGHSVCAHYGAQITPETPLGYSDSQLLVGFQHNVPDNSLPVFWKRSPERAWYAIFVRKEKH